MKTFNNYEDLLNNIGVTFSSHNKYANEELNNFLECIGSTEEGEQIEGYFNLEIEGNSYDIAVTHIIKDDEEIEYKYHIL